MYRRAVVIMLGISLAGPLAVDAAQQQSLFEASGESRRNAQDHEHQQPEGQDDHAGHVQHATEGGEMTFAPREASGTAWLPDDTPMYGLHSRAGSWDLMWHGNAFAQFLYERGPRGEEQGGSINWVMAMARRPAAGGRLGIRTMFSLEPWSIPGCGYPDLLATGEVCDGEAIHDRQHPHDFFMELAAEYERPLAGALRWHVYGGLAAEPALGPVAYPHRTSATPNPLAPISHHWLDSTHIAFGVVTGGISHRRWKAEASVFNGREPDAERWNIDLAALDSLSGRVSFAPTSAIVLQLSAGHLNEAEAGEGEGPRVDVDRVTASATYHRTISADSLWATTLAWGRNVEDDTTDALMLETSVTIDDRDAWFGRFEIGTKAAHDLGVHGTDEVFTVSKLQAGYTRYLSVWRGLQPGVGAGLSLGIVPETLESVYRRRANAGFALFLTLRPGRHRM